MTREEAIDIILNDVNTHTIREGIALNMAIKALEQEPILDKIRAEIEQIAKDYDKFADYRRVRGLWIALEIIDKYKAESDGAKVLENPTNANKEMD